MSRIAETFGTNQQERARDPRHAMILCGHQGDMRSIDVSSAGNLRSMSTIHLVKIFSNFNV